jgi:hypothetical protein
MRKTDAGGAGAERLTAESLQIHLSGRSLGMEKPQRPHFSALRPRSLILGLQSTPSQLFHIRLLILRPLKLKSSSLNTLPSSA